MICLATLQRNPFILRNLDFSLKITKMSENCLLSTFDHEVVYDIATLQRNLLIPRNLNFSLKINKMSENCVNSVILIVKLSKMTINASVHF